jgi:hypothetical protein
MGIVRLSCLDGGDESGLGRMLCSVLSRGAGERRTAKRTPEGPSQVFVDGEIGRGHAGMQVQEKYKGAVWLFRDILSSSPASASNSVIHHYYYRNSNHQSVYT